MAARPDPLVGKVLAERFEVLERIGEGGTGVVYRAKQLSVDRIIAIKVLGAHVSTDPSWVKRFHNEARAASRLDHPNTVRLIDFGQTREGLLFIAMEFLHGRSLRQEIERARRLPGNRALRIVSQICASLGEAHNQGIIHRDIKPDNIYLVEVKGATGDYVKVLDFSVAKVDTPDAQVTRAGVVFGTPAYMSPEQGRGLALDSRSDIYAVGVVAYEMLSGRPPFDAKVPTEVVMMHLRDRPPPLTDVPAAIAQLVMKALDKDPARRQQTAAELDVECQACLAELYPRAAPAAGMPNHPPKSNDPLAFAATVSPFAEAKTMLGVEAPPVSGRPIGEQKTQLATPVLELTAPPSPPTAAPPPEAPSRSPRVGPLATAGPPPPAGALAGIGPPPPASPRPAARDARTVPAGAPVSAEQKTLMAPAPGSGPGTQILPDSAGVVAFADGRAIQGQPAAPVRPAGALFWLAWALIGLGAGLGIHFVLMARSGS